MNKEEIERYKIRDYYMIPVEIVDNIFYSFEQQNKKYKEVIDKAIEYIEQNKSQFINQYGYIESDDELVYAEDLLDILKEVE